LPAGGRPAGTLLGGRVTYQQPPHGYRTGIEPVLLAASIQARPGEHVVEAGAGAGAGLLSLAARVAGLTGIGLELDPVMAEAAQHNIAANGQTGLSVQIQDVIAWRPPRPFDHAFANPPWHATEGTQPLDAGRRLAKFAADDVLAGWTASLARALRPRGTLSLIVPAALLARGIAALGVAGCAEIAVFPLWPRADIEAKLVILRGVRQGRGPCRMLPGLLLHDETGGFTPPARRVLWDGEALPF
jgi:tRNA1(Val) A37 N6-methylase TrmN6